MGIQKRIVLLAGFLGAGKTTLLNHIISGKTDMSGVVVIINEFGKIGIDASLIKRQDAEIVELTSGCICCTLAVDLRILLNKIFLQYNPHLVFIEASGIADPSALISIFNEDEIRSQIESYWTVTILDASFWEMRTIMGDIIHCQIDPADLILLNKVDLLEPDKIEQYINEVKENNPDTLVVPTVHGRIDLEEYLWSARKKNDNSLSQDHYKGHDSRSSDNGFMTFSYQDPRPLDESRFKNFVNELPFNVFRMKGTVRFQDRTVMVNHVGGRSEWSVEEKAQETSLVFIGWDIQTDEILLRLEQVQSGQISELYSV